MSDSARTMAMPDIPEDEWLLLANALAEPMEQLIAVETTDTDQLREVEHRLLELAGGRPVLRQAVRPGQERPEAVWRLAREITATPMPALPLLIITMDAWPRDLEQRRMLADFWCGMNQLRENWHELPAQILFLLSPAAYEHLTLNADHLKRWISLKIRLWKGARDLAVLARPGSVPIGSPESARATQDAEGFLTGKPISHEDLLGGYLQSLARQAEEAKRQGEAPMELARRYYLPLISGHLELGNKAEAKAWLNRVEPEFLESSELQRLIDAELAVASDEKFFDVFLSHNRRNKRTVRKLSQALKSHGLKVWVDEEQLVPGQPWQEALATLAQRTRSAAVLIGRDGLGPWEDLEMRACLSEFVKRGLPVIPVLLPGAHAEPKLPLFLQNRTWVDLRGGYTQEGLGRLLWGINGQRIGKPAVSPNPPPSYRSEHPVLTAWKAKLDFLLQEEARSADAEQKLRLSKLIEEAWKKITELGD